MIVLSRWHGLIARRLLKREILAQVCAKHSVTPDAVRSEARATALVKARQEAMLRMREEGHSAPSIGRFLQRDHTTVLYGAQRAREAA
jgi:chromosomal replication initiation ATPase DnaA